MDWNTLGLLILNYAILIAAGWFILALIIIVISIIYNQLTG